MPGAESLEESALEKPRVVSRCGCGCASVDFVRLKEWGALRSVADGIGTTDAGGRVGVLAWGKGGRLLGLEIYDLGDGQSDLTLPAPESVHPW